MMGKGITLTGQCSAVANSDKLAGAESDRVEDRPCGGWLAELAILGLKVC